MVGALFHGFEAALFAGDNRDRNSRKGGVALAAVMNSLPLILGIWISVIMMSGRPTQVFKCLVSAGQTWLLVSSGVAADKPSVSAQPYWRLATKTSSAKPGDYLKIRF
jgi:hypothetical protein